MDIKEISKQINENAHAKGFWDKGVDIPKNLMLIVSEVAEAMEADRNNRYCDWEDRLPLFDEYHRKNMGDRFTKSFEDNVKDRFEDEIADTVIRLFDLAYEMGFDLEWHIRQKVRYNKSRPKMHGGKKY